MLYRLLLTSLLVTTTGPRPTLPPAATVDSAIARMGGRPALESIVRIRREMLTQWQRVNFDDRPYSDAPSYELHADVRDYSIPAWRNTRKFSNGGTWSEILDIVRDSVGGRRFKDSWAPLNIAYVDERRELFTFAPERVLLLARDAADLRGLSDTAIGGLPHTRLSATLNGMPTTLFIRQGDGLLALVRFRAAQPNDFGLAPWGTMDVEIWFSKWTRTPRGVTLPTQWDTRRVNRPYKRITVLATTFDTIASPDSFIVSDSVRSAFLANSRKPMHDMPLDSARVVDESFALFNTAGAAPGAVKLGDGWWILESGQAPFNAERVTQWLAARGGKVEGAFVTVASGSNGGIVSLVAQHQRVQIAPAMQPIAAAILRNHGQPANGATVVTRGAWQRMNRDSVWVEPIDYPDLPGAMFLYVPSLRWAYSGAAASPLQLEYLARRLKARGFVVERVGSVRNVLTPVPSGVSSNAGNR